MPIQTMLRHTSKALLVVVFFLAGCVSFGNGTAGDTATAVNASPPPEFPHVYLLNEYGVVTLRASDGKERWQFHLPLPAQRTTALAVEGSQVYVGTDRAFFALDTVTGHLLWTAEAAPQIQRILPVGTTIYVGSTSSVYAFSASDGTPLWTQQVPGGDTSLLVIHNGLLYVGGSLSATLTALDAETGTPRWHFLLPVGEGITTLISQGDLLLLQSRDALDALRASDGTLRWQRNTSIQALQVFNGIIYLVFIDLPAVSSPGPTLSGLRALRASDGAQLWQVVTPVAVDGEEDFFTPDSIYRATTSAQQNLSAWRTADGTLRWHTTSQQGIASLWVDDGSIYTTSGDEIDAWQATNGAPLWQYTPNGRVSTLSMVNQMLYGLNDLDASGFVVAMNVGQGTALWQARLGSMLTQVLVA